MKWIESSLLKIIILALIVKYWISKKFMVENSVFKKFDKISYTAADNARYSKFFKYSTRNDKEKYSDMVCHRQGRKEGLKEYAIVNECLKIGFFISDDLVVEHIKNDKRFYNDKDQFDLNIFAKTLKEMNLTEMEYKKLKLFELYRKQWEFYIKNSIAINISKEDACQYLRGKKQTRSGNYCSLEKKLIEIAEPSENELIEFYKNNIHKYKVSDTHEYKILKITAKEYDKLSRKDQQILLDIMKDNNYEWVLNNYNCMQTSGSVKNIEPFADEIHLNNLYQKKFLLDVAKLHGRLPINTGITVTDKYDNIYYFYCYNIIKNSNDNFENIKSKVLADYKNTKYIDHAKNMELKYKTLSNVSINTDNNKNIAEYLYNTDKINEVNYYEDQNFIHAVILTEIENVAVLDEHEIESAHQELINILSNEAVYCAKQAIVNKYDSFDS